MSQQRPGSLRRRDRGRTQSLRPPARVMDCAGRAPAATALSRGGDSLSPPFQPATGGTGDPPCGFSFRNPHSEFRTRQAPRVERVLTLRVLAYAPAFGVRARLPPLWSVRAFVVQRPVADPQPNAHRSALCFLLPTLHPLYPATSGCIRP